MHVKKKKPKTLNHKLFSPKSVDLQKLSENKIHHALKMLEIPFHKEQFFRTRSLFAESLSAPLIPYSLSPHLTPNLSAGAILYSYTSARLKMPTQITAWHIAWTPLPILNEQHSAISATD